MDRLDVQTSRRQRVLVVILALIFVPLAAGSLFTGLASGGGVVPLAMGVLMLATFGGVMWIIRRGHTKSVRYFSAEGLQRNDGRWLAWTELERVVDQVRIDPRASGDKEAVAHGDLVPRRPVGVAAPRAHQQPRRGRWPGPHPAVRARGSAGLSGTGAIPAPLSERIQRRIDALKTDGVARWPARVCKERMNALPLRGNQLTVWALRADGTVLTLDLDSVSHAFEEEPSPVARYAVLSEAARQVPELGVLVPPRPPGLEPCDTCGGEGWMEATREACGGCAGLGWRMRPRPVAEWMERIDRGDQLRLRIDGQGGHGLVAGRLAGLYVARADDLPFWCAPADDRGRRQLDEHLRRFGWEHRFGYQKHAAATWQPNATGAPDPFQSETHGLRFHGTGSGGGYVVDIARQPGGRYTVATTLDNDWDPMGGAMPATRTRELDEASARAEVEREMREAGSLPSIVPRSGV